MYVGTGRNITICITLLVFVSLVSPGMAGRNDSNAEIKNAEPRPTPDTVPALQPINLMMQPIVTDNQNTAFVVAGVAQVPVDAVLEVSTVSNFSIGTGTTFTAVNGTADVLATGVFRIQALLLLGLTVYYYRVRLFNGGDYVYWPNTTTTAQTRTAMPGGTYPSNGATIGRVYTRGNTTLMGQYFLGIFQAETNGVQSFYMSVLSAATSLCSFNCNNIRRPSDTDYMQFTAATIMRWGAYGIKWGKFWYNNTIAGGEPTSGVNPAGPGQYTGTIAPPALYDIRVDMYVPPPSWALYNGRNYKTFTNSLTPGWLASDLAISIMNYMNTNYAEGLTEIDVTVTMYDTVGGSLIMCYYFDALSMWMDDFALVDGDTYVVEILNNVLDTQPRSYQLPNSAIAGPVSLPIYNGRNYRGTPVITSGAMMASELAMDIIASINLGYGENLTNLDVTVTMYDTVAGSLITCYYFDALSMWMDDFALDPQAGYIIEILNNRLVTQPRAYVP